jgi:uncharacterized RDD family membrane protein YckC
MKLARRVLLGVLLLVLVGGCSAVATMNDLSTAGYQVSQVSTNSSNDVTTLVVVANPPPGRDPQQALDDAARIIWRTHPGPVDVLELTVGPQSETVTGWQLAQAYGPRDPSLTGPRQSTHDQVRSTFSVISGVIAGLGVLSGVAALVVAVVARRRVDRGPIPPGTDPTAVVGRRAAQFVIDHGVWNAPVMIVYAGVIQLFFLSPPTAAILTVVWLVAAYWWGWFTYAGRAAHHGGRTLGMRRLGLRIVDLSTGGPVPRRLLTRRWLLFLVDGAFAGLLGLLVIALGPRHQRVGDLAARTVVVRDPSPGTDALSVRDELDSVNHRTS